MKMYPVCLKLYSVKFCLSTNRVQYWIPRFSLFVHSSVEKNVFSGNRGDKIIISYLPGRWVYIYCKISTICWNEFFEKKNVFVSFGVSLFERGFLECYEANKT